MFTLTLSHDLSEFGIVDIVDVSWAEVGCWESQNGLTWSMVSQFNPYLGRHKFHVIYDASRPLL